MANSNDPGQWQDDYDWTFTPSRTAPRCTLRIYIPLARYASSTDAYYWLSDNGDFRDAAKGIGRFILNQAANQGRWVTEGPFTFTHGVIGIELTDRGTGFDTTVAVAPIRVTC